MRLKSVDPAILDQKEKESIVPEKSHPYPGNESKRSDDLQPVHRRCFSRILPRKIGRGRRRRGRG